MYFFCKAIIVKVSLGVRFLISEVVVDSEYGGHAKGLMGNFDGNPTNDFILPNGTILNKNLTKTERNVYNNFGQQCKIFFNQKTEKKIYRFNFGSICLCILCPVCDRKKIIISYRQLDF